MELTNLSMPKFNTTMLGVLRGVVTYFGLPGSDAILFGGSGHAFLINIHRQLCPSGPYCWNHAPYIRLIANLGVEMTDHGFFSPQRSEKERERLDALMVGLLDAGVPCALLNMENQLITGYDDTGFLTAQPWAPCVDFPQKHLTFGTWAEFGADYHVSFFTFSRCEPQSQPVIFRDSLQYALDLIANPTAHTSDAYGAGLRAYDYWICAVNDGAGASHGNWWNGTVWSECRQMAAQYLREIGAALPDIRELAEPLAERYATISANLERAADKAMDAGEKVALLAETRELEAGCAPLLVEVASRITV
jgi:hypothetical protein